MREIKFRAWDKINKKMRNVDSMAFNQYTRDIKVINMWGKDIIEDKDIILHKDTEKKINNVVLMQYTELNDRNGKEVYEGDIFKSGNNMYEVIFKDGGFCAKQTNCNYYEFVVKFLPFEVIGNIYENSHLLI